MGRDGDEGPGTKGGALRPGAEVWYLPAAGGKLRVVVERVVGTTLDKPVRHWLIRPTDGGRVRVVASYSLSLTEPDWL